MKISPYVVSAVLAMSFASAHAHGGAHRQPIRVAQCEAGDCTEKEVTQGGADLIAKFAEGGKLDRSWKEVKTASGAKRKEAGWIILYENPRAPDKNRRTFYLYVSQDGFFKGASFTGQ